MGSFGSVTASTAAPPCVSLLCWGIFSIFTSIHRSAFDVEQGTTKEKCPWVGIEQSMLEVLPFSSPHLT